MSMDEEKKENLNFISDFLLRVAMISGNANLDRTLDSKPGNDINDTRNLISVKNEKGYYITYGMSDGNIQRCLQKHDSNIIAKTVSTQKMNAMEFKKADFNTREGLEGNKYKMIAGDAYPWDAVYGVKCDLFREIDGNVDMSPKTEMDKRWSIVGTLINGACEVARGRTPKDTPIEKKIQKLNGLISEITALSENVSINILDGKYYISAPTKDGNFIVYSTTDSKLETEDNHIFTVQKTSKELDVEELKSESDSQLSLLDGKETTLDEIKANLSKDLGIAEHTAEEIGEGIKGLTQGEVGDALNAITDITELQKDPHTLE